jgi:hypothetical protein
MLAVMIAVTIGVLSAQSGVTKSTVVRERIDTGNAYIADCIIDEIGWIDNPTKLSTKLKTFYDETGCQPYIILRAYDESMSTDAARNNWSQTYYDEHFAENQNVVLYTYFCDEYDDGYGDDTLYVGKDSAVVFDAEAQEIFWNYLDYDWNSWDVNDNDGMFADVFNKTADRIMKVSTTSKDIVKYIIIVIIAVVVIGGAILGFVLKSRREKEKNEETARILNSNIHDMAKSDLDDKNL